MTINDLNDPRSLSMPVPLRLLIGAVILLALFSAFMLITGHQDVHRVRWATGETQEQYVVRRGGIPVEPAFRVEVGMMDNGTVVWRLLPAGRPPGTTTNTQP